MFLCIPAAVGLSVLAFPITGVLFPAASELSGKLLCVGAITVVFSAVSTISNGVLQAIGRPRIPLRNAAISLVLNVITVCACSYLFPQIGVFSVIAANLVFAVAMCVLNALALKKYLGYKNDFVNGYVKSFTAAAVMGAFAWGIYYGLYQLLPVRIICLGVAIIFAVCIYLISIEYIDDTVKKTLEEVTDREADFDVLFVDGDKIEEKIAARHDRIQRRIRSLREERIARRTPSEDEESEDEE